MVKSNQVCARMKIETSDCQPTIAKIEVFSTRGPVVYMLKETLADPR
jgi:hypothetical protein